MAKPMLGFHVEGFKEIDRVLAALPAATSEKILRDAMRKSCNPVVETAQSLVPHKSGRLEESIKIGTRTTREMQRDVRGEVAVYIGPTRKKGFYGFFWEFGTSKIPARPAMRPAWDKHKDQMLDTFKHEIWQKIYKVAKRLAKKGGF